MAEQPSSAYTDPFYDRLDAIFSWLGRYWLLVILALLLATAGIIYLRQTLAANPTAESAAALYRARNAGLEQMRAFVDDEQYTPESRARAALDLSQERLQREEFADAQRFAQKAVDLAAQTELENLQAAATMTLASVYESAGQLAEARRHYLDVVQKYRGRHLGYTLSADIAAALLATQLAEASDDAESAEELRWEALQSLHDYVDQQPSRETYYILSAAVWRYYDMRRNFPDLAARLDDHLGIERPPGVALPAGTDPLQQDSPLPDPADDAPSVDDMLPPTDAEDED